jgi:hypothetical protein
MAYGKKELIEDISDIRRLAGLAEAPKKAAPAAKPAANPDPNNYGSFSTNNNSPYGFAQGGSSDDTNANFFASDKRMRDAQQAAPAAPKPAAPKPAAPAAPKPNAYKGTIADFKRENPGATDGQALNAIQGKTAIRGGNNDPSVIAAKRDADSATGPVQPVYNPQSGTTMRKGEVPGQVPNRNTEPGYSGATGAELLKPGVKNAPPTGASPSAPTTRGVSPSAPSAPTTRAPSTPRTPELLTPIVRPDSPRDTSTTGGYDLDDRTDPMPEPAPAPQAAPKAAPAPTPRQPEMFTDPDQSRNIPGKDPQPAKPANPWNNKTFQHVPAQLPPGAADKVFQTVPGAKPEIPTSGFTNEPIPDSDKFAPAVKPLEKQTSNWGTTKNVFASKNNSIFPHEVIKELRQMAGLDNDEAPANEVVSEFNDEDMEEGNEFSGALANAKAAHKDEFEVDGKTYPVKEGIEVNPMNDSLALMKKLAGLK